MTTPLGRVRGLGSAKSGTLEYVTKQFSGVILALMTPYVIVIIIMLIGQPYLRGHTGKGLGKVSRGRATP